MFSSSFCFVSYIHGVPSPREIPISFTHTHRARSGLTYFEYAVKLWYCIIISMLCCMLIWPFIVRVFNMASVWYVHSTSSSSSSSSRFQQITIKKMHIVCAWMQVNLISSAESTVFGRHTVVNTNWNEQNVLSWEIQCREPQIVHRNILRGKYEWMPNDQQMKTEENVYEMIIKIFLMFIIHFSFQWTATVCVCMRNDHSQGLFGSTQNVNEVKVDAFGRDRSMI